MSTSLTLDFIAQFNLLDKYLEQVLNDADEHMNFAHKLKILSQGEYEISHVITQYFYELNTISSIRNQLVHGISQTGDDYITVTEYGLQRLTSLISIIMQPPTCGSWYTKVVTTLQSDITMQQSIQFLSELDYDHIPVYQGEQYYMTLTDGVVMKLIAQGVQLDALLIDHLECIEMTDVYRCSTQDSIHKAQSWLLNHNNGVIYMTHDGLPSHHLLGVITEHDLVSHSDLGLQHNGQSV